MGERLVTERETVLELRLEIGSQPIRGTLTATHGAGVAFAGWIELACLLEQSHREPERPEHAA